MNENFTDSEIAKLPKWAQSKIVSLQMSLGAARGELKRFTDDQTESKFFVDSWYSPTRHRRFVQTPADRVTVEHAGAHLEIYCPPRNDPQRVYGIELRFRSTAVSTNFGEVALFPVNYGTVSIICRGNS
jgi:hypothetical protein